MEQEGRTCTSVNVTAIEQNNASTQMIFRESGRNMSMHLSDSNGERDI